jgi:Glycosyl hydrolases family 18
MAVRLCMLWKRTISKICLLVVGGLLLCCAGLLAGAAPTASGPAVVAYVFARNGVLPPGEIDAGKLTRVNYAFANIQASRIVPGYPSDGDNFAALLALKRKNPALTVLVSVGGWLWSDNFSATALTRGSRKLFVAEWGVHPLLGPCRFSSLPILSSETDLRQLRGSAVAGVEVQICPRAQTRRRDVLGVLQ